MTPQRPPTVSVIEPIGPAFEKVKTILFSPFDLRKWFVIGFCAWLAYLGSSGGGGGGRGPQFNIHHEKGWDAQIADALNETKEFILENLYWIMPVVVIIAIFSIILWLVITWFNSQGRFMFLHCVAQNKAEVVNPWRKFKRHANNLFLFRIVLDIIGFVIVGLPILGIIFLVIMTVYKTGSHVFSIPVIVLFALLIFAISIILFLVKKLTLDFVVPIMSLRTSSIIAGWREFMTILSVNKLRFALYILFQIVIAIAIGAIIAIGACIGCCLCCVSALLFIPYIGTVILLPLLVFDRSYSLYYLQQFGPAFDVFSPAST